MLDILRDFINGLSDEGGRRKSPRENPDVAAVALFFSVIGADGEVTDEERALLRDLVAKDYSESEAELKELLAEAEAADRDSVDLYAFTSVLNWKLTPEEKIRFIELLWELAYADGVRHELEDHVVWRIADLMGVDTRDRVFARQRVAERRGITGETDT